MTRRPVRLGVGAVAAPATAGFIQGASATAAFGSVRRAWDADVLAPGVRRHLVETKSEWPLDTFLANGKS
jgi:hypothetical protein